jgi:hypothetical protein
MTDRLDTTSSKQVTHFFWLHYHLLYILQVPTTSDLGKKAAMAMPLLTKADEATPASYRNMRPSGFGRNLRSRMARIFGDSGGRRINQQVYMYLFGLIFTTVMGIYWASYSSTEDTVSLVAPEFEDLVAPSRLDGPVGTSRESVFAVADDLKSINWTTMQRNTNTDTDAEIARKTDVTFNKIKNQGEVSETRRMGTATDAPRDKPQTKTKPLNILILYGDDWRHDAMVGQTEASTICAIKI